MANEIQRISWAGDAYGELRLVIDSAPTDYFDISSDWNNAMPVGVVATPGANYVDLEFTDGQSHDLVQVESSPVKPLNDNSASATDVSHDLGQNAVAYLYATYVGGNFSTSLTIVEHPTTNPLNVTVSMFQSDNWDTELNAAGWGVPPGLEITADSIVDNGDDGEAILAGTRKRPLQFVANDITGTTVIDQTVEEDASLGAYATIVITPQAGKVGWFVLQEDNESTPVSLSTGLTEEQLVSAVNAALSALMIDGVAIDGDITLLITNPEAYGEPSYSITSETMGDAVVPNVAVTQEAEEETMPEFGTVTATVRDLLIWTARSPSDLSSVVDAGRLGYQRRMRNGLSAQQVDRVWHTTVTLNGTEEHVYTLSDLVFYLFASPIAVTFRYVKVLQAINHDTLNPLYIGGAEANTWQALFGSDTDLLLLPPDGLVQLVHPQDGWPVLPDESDQLRIYNPNEDPVTYSLVLLGTSESEAS